MNEVYLVMKSDRHKLYVMNDVFNSERTYKHRPVAIFLSKEDAWSYAKNFKLSDLPANAKHYLEINGANSSSDVYLNGNFYYHDNLHYNLLVFHL